MDLETEIAGQDLRQFYKLLQFLHKIGTNLYIEATTAKFQLSSLSDSKSAFTLINLSPNFFHSYVLSSTTPAATLKCCLPLPPLLAIFKGNHQPGKPPKPPATKPDVDGCKLHISQDQLTIHFKSPTSAAKVSFHLHLINAPSHPHPIYTKSACPNVWASVTDPLVAISGHFHTKCDDIVMRCSRTKLTWRTVEPDVHSTHDPSAPNSLAMMASAVDMPVDHLDPYRTTDVEVCFGWREFKVLLGVADFLGVRICAHFSGPGAVSNSDLYHIDLVLATVHGDVMNTPPSAVLPPVHKSPRLPSSAMPMKENVTATTTSADLFAFPARDAPRPHKPPSAVLFPFSTPPSRQNTLLTKVGQPSLGQSFNSFNSDHHPIAPNGPRSSVSHHTSSTSSSGSDTDDHIPATPPPCSKRGRLMF